MKETLSAFMDGEAPHAEVVTLLTELQTDGELRASWSRAHLLRASLRNETLPVLDANFCSRVTAAVQADHNPKVVALAEPRRHRPLPRRMMTFAAAASVAVVAVLVGSHMMNADTAGPGQQPAELMARTTPHQQTDFAYRQASAPTGHVQPRRSRKASPRVVRWEVSDPDVQAQLDNYLFEHYGLATGYGVSDTAPSILQYAAYNPGVGQ